MFHHHMEDHVLLINDKLNKAICNSYYNHVFLESFKGQHLSKCNYTSHGPLPLSLAYP
jgi:hypothetical protein